MARSRRRKAKSTRRISGKVLIACGLLALAGVAALLAWEKARHWRPDETRWPDQGAILGERDGFVNFSALKGLGAKLVYLEASHGAGRQDARFPANLAAARSAGLEVGAVHEFDPCVPADRQSANFVTVVPRDSSLLPPVILMDRTAEDCPTRVFDAAVQSELMTLVNQIEAHAGKEVILSPSEGFDQAYGISSRVRRNLWLTRPFLEPAYGARPWVMWTANPIMATEASDHPLRWMVVQP